MAEYFTRPVLYGTTQYEPGDRVPEGAALADAWKKTGAASERPPRTFPGPRARLVTAQPGDPVTDPSGAPAGLADKIPETPDRKRPRRSRRKDP